MVEICASQVNELRFQEALDELFRVLEGEFGECARFEQETTEGVTYWTITPINPSASPLGLSGTCWDDVTVGFGRSSGRFELWEVAGKGDRERYGMLEEICRAVIAGQLTEHRNNEKSCYYELILPSGEKLRGAANTLFRRRWRTIEHFAPYCPVDQLEHERGAPSSEIAASSAVSTTSSSSAGHGM